MVWAIIENKLKGITHAAGLQMHKGVTKWLRISFSCLPGQVPAIQVCLRLRHDNPTEDRIFSSSLSHDRTAVDRDAGLEGASSTF